MHLQTTSGSHELLQTAVEVEIWEGYLVNKSDAGKTLCTYSLDNGPMNEGPDGNLLFRFTGYDWDRHLRQYLASNNIHYSMVRELSVDPLQQLLKKKIYLVEGDPDFLVALNMILQDAGYHVKVSSIGQPVMDGHYSSIDLFILDRQIPDVNGLDICRHLRSQFTTRDVPVIMISAHPKNGNEALNAGANDYLEKPFEIHYFLNIVSKYTRLNSKNTMS